ncbi:hypothetical protein AVEN_189298-1 [Araneus ventricosus]|uniref:Uncharacterized protein n=1 Tax=Araneus ventricosus TaxID=182803 RepID=A0A4Y2SLE3_ARAVE|nr:hypothetical protein AVEN_110851-1 [Araneus ventricosus]GBN87975.1 hypothetical protein AVEN_189298-1 [Araneus ventricosus]
MKVTSELSLVTSFCLGTVKQSMMANIMSSVLLPKSERRLFEFFLQIVEVGGEGVEIERGVLKWTEEFGDMSVKFSSLMVARSLWLTSEVFWIEVGGN